MEGDARRQSLVDDALALGRELRSEPGNKGHSGQRGSGTHRHSQGWDAGNSGDGEPAWRATQSRNPEARQVNPADAPHHAFWGGLARTAPGPLTLADLANTAKGRALLTSCQVRHVMAATGAIEQQRKQ